jgi:hypothetical protein
MTDVNRCDCGWCETDENVNPHRQKCPSCGAPFFEREEIRWFMPDTTTTESSQEAESDD